ncbi:DUF4861 domain-containing protein [Kaistella flava (ex Peng et al. 2021)]|uniref:DUF4861 domain-containing protein n=1 Tax=Kaistella flava (ex Peng et al. 2021) TaxID=2038776 RepID=A0A7M2Y8K0_9FLAO|nr:DUF4861 family protein [Kaistella flava (ex Peng et al. 2021)]QOW10426.1 DUF4861 domain-containing protein [Kaistella flava (ex Peng et al. 2021)]
MKIYKVAAIAVILSQTISCNSQKVNSNKEQKTNAEISVKEGGKWNGRKYEGGTWKSVQSHTLDPLHTDHSFDIRYEGPGWESNKIAYRLYLDWRNAIDIFGKTSKKIILPEVGLDGFDSYHLRQDWGSDVLKVGKGVGLGSITRIVDDKMYRFETVDKTSANVENSAKKSTVNIDYIGWKTLNDKIDLKAKLSIFPDERFTKYSFTPSAPISGIATGIVKVKKEELLQKKSANGKWGYIATFGNQSMFDDGLGMALFYETSTIAEVKDGPFDYLVVFKPTTKEVTYYFLASWEKEQDALKTKEEFQNYINIKLDQLNSKNKL